MAYNKPNIQCHFCLISKLFTLGNIIFNSGFASLNINYLGWIISDNSLKGMECLLNNEIINSNNFRHFCDNVCSKVVFLLCLMKIAILVLFRCWKKNNIKKTWHRRIYSIYQQCEWSSSQKKTWTRWEEFFCANGHKQPYVKSPDLTHVSPRFRTIFFVALPVSRHPDIKILLLQKHFWFATF